MPGPRGTAQRGDHRSEFDDPVEHAYDPELRCN